MRISDGRIAFDVERCNHGSAPVEVRGGELRVGELATTRRLCGAEETTVERAVTRVLRGTVAYEVEADVLTLTGPDGDGLVLRAR